MREMREVRGRNRDVGTLLNERTLYSDFEALFLLQALRKGIRDKCEGLYSVWECWVCSVWTLWFLRIFHCHEFNRRFTILVKLR